MPVLLVAFFQQEAMQQQSALENEKEQLSQELASVQRRTSDDKGYYRLVATSSHFII